MPTYELTMESTDRRSEDIRYRSFTTSRATAELFARSVTKIQFTDSGHGIVAHMRELKPRENRKPKITTLIQHVHACMHPGKR